VRQPTENGPTNIRPTIVINERKVAVITVFPARDVITLDPSNPSADCVAVNEGRILHVARRSDVRDWLIGREYLEDDRLADAILVPGFIEAHGHVSGDGALSSRPWLGYDERPRPDGTIAQACRSVDDVVKRLQQALKDFAGGQLVGVGFDPVFLDRTLNRHDLDRVSTSVEVVVVNASAHLAYANSAALRAHGVNNETSVPGVIKDQNGEPNGELHERAMGLVLDLTAILGDPELDTKAGAELARRVGVTTVSDLACFALGNGFNQLRRMASSNELPARLAYSPLVEALSQALGEGLVGYLEEQRTLDTERFFMGPCKLITDGSIQGFTAALGWPGYCGGHDDLAQLLLDASSILRLAGPLHEAGFQLALHTNGDLAIQAALDAIGQMLEQHPRYGHGHRLEHCQMASRAQLVRMAQLGIGVNLFVNHVYYWGDIHRSRTMGPDRARRMDGVASALREGLNVAIHSDHPVTPVNPLFSMWVARTRKTRSGFVLGEEERVSAQQALEAVTLGPARLLKKEAVLGSLEVGKFADFAALSGNPLQEDADALLSLKVLDTVLGGIPTDDLR